MRILILGGNGQTGRLVIDEALQRGHKITALIRDPSTIPVKNDLNIVKGTPLEPSDIEKAFNAVKGDPPTAVIVTLAAVADKESRVMTGAYECVIAAMKSHGVSKIATISSFGIGSSLKNITFIMRWAIANTSLGVKFADHNQADETLKKSGLDFVQLRPARLTMGPKAPVTYLGDDGLRDDGKGLGIFAGLGGISRASVAGCLVDAVEKNTWDGRTPVITN
ncbi:hypothetical protein V491_07189 [Pseudogymnoascus sp. VKM F-3775]|nr:hypothetical protein V491_07189 [Pseudogymnoascus sp. VKM F-3775]